MYTSQILMGPWVRYQISMKVFQYLDIFDFSVALIGRYFLRYFTYATINPKWIHIYHRILIYIFGKSVNIDYFA